MKSFFNRIPVPAQLFIVCFIQSGIITVNMRAIAQANYPFAFVSDMGLFMFGFFIVKQIVEAKRFRDAFWYALGGATGAQLCIWLTEMAFGK